MTIPADPILYGHNGDPGLVAADLVPGGDAPDRIALFIREGQSTARKDDSFAPFILVDERKMSDSRLDLSLCPVRFDSSRLAGSGELNLVLTFRSWRECADSARWLSISTGSRSRDRSAGYLFINDPVRQYLTVSGRTLFKGLEFEDVRRMQVDIECVTTEGYEFCNADREGDSIIAIGLADQSGWVEVISCTDMPEKELLERFVEIVRERDPDVLEGHNICNFDLPYISARAKLHGVRLDVGRDGSCPRSRSSRLPLGERNASYTRFDIFGRHVVDTLFLAQAYDLSERSLTGFGLKNVAAHFGLSAPDRTYIAGSGISAEFRRNPGNVMKYVRDDVTETRSVSNLFSRSYVLQARMIPYSYQDVCVRGNATKIDALMLREYLRQGHAIPLPDFQREFEGGYTDMFVQGVVKNVHHCDVRSLYPSMMLAKRIGPKKDELGVFLKMLELLRSFRLAAKKQMQESTSGAERDRMDAFQKTVKVLINSFYGYMGFPQGQFSDFDAAEQVTAEGRALLQNMISELTRLGAKAVEIDTDGIYFVPPSFKSSSETTGFRLEFEKTLPTGIEVEFDGEYTAMFSYKMKNYALLCGNGEVIIKGAALKSRGLEPFQRKFMREAIRLKLEDREGEIPGLKSRYGKAIERREWAIEEFAKTVTLQDSPSTYAARVAQKARARDAAYELALKSGREYHAGDQLSFYMTGDRKNVAAHQNAKLVSEADPDKRDENVSFYLAKLDALYRKFYDTPASDDAQTELGI